MTQFDDEILDSAVRWREIVWRSGLKNEDERLDQLRTICTELCDGDPRKGAELATRALWSPSRPRPLVAVRRRVLE